MCRMSTQRSWFETDFDEPVHPLRPSGVVSRGGDSALRIAEGFVRGVAIVGRFASADNVIAVKLAAQARPVRLHLRQRSGLEPLADARLPRALQVVAQGLPRAAALLRPPYPAPVSLPVTISLTAG